MKAKLIKLLQDYRYMGFPIQGPWSYVDMRTDVNKPPEWQVELADAIDELYKFNQQT